MKRLKYFLLGAACFYISQPLLRINILNALNRNLDYTLWTSVHVVWNMAFLAVTAGIFEETARYFMRKYIARESRYESAFLFGVGHWLCEAVWIWFVSVRPYTVSLPVGFVFERIMVFGVQVALTIFIFRSFVFGGELKALGTAILFHAAYDFVIIFMAASVFMEKVLYVEFVVFLIGIWYIISARKLNWGNENEKVS